MKISKLMLMTATVMVLGAGPAAAATYTYCSYFYDADPFQINKVDISATYRPTIQVIKNANGVVMDGVDVVIEYLQTLPNMTANPVLNRTTVKEPLPAYLTGSAEMQPWSGAF